MRLVFHFMFILRAGPVFTLLTQVDDLTAFRNAATIPWVLLAANARLLSTFGWRFRIWSSSYTTVTRFQRWRIL